MRALFIQALLRLCAALPLPAAHRLGEGIGWLLTVIPNDLRRVTAANLRLCLPDWDAAQRDTLARRSLIETAKTMAEAGAMWLWGRERVLGLVRSVSGGDHLNAALTQKKGVILAIPHLGDWEMVGLYVSAHHPMTSLYRPPRIPALDSLMRHARERLGARLVPTDASGVRALYQALGRGEVVAILPDQEPRGGNGVFAPFFGVPAYSMVLLSRLAMKSGATVLLSYAERLPHGRGFHLHFEPAPAAINTGAVLESVATVNKLVEDAARRLPEQYQWGYKRFRTRPPGEPRAYSRVNRA